MKCNSAILALWSAAALTLTACGGGDDAAPTPAPAPAQPTVNVEDLATGSYVVSLGDESAPVVGKYYAAADGSRLLIVADGADQATRVYRRSAGEAWVAVPAATQNLSVNLLRGDASVVATPTLAALAGNYVTQVASGDTANFSVNASGDITAGSSSCKLSGKLAAGTLPGTLKLSLASSACAGLPASSSGVVTLDSDYAPAKFRLVADGSNQLVDLWAFAE